MAEQTQVLEYKCPCCDAPLKFDQDQQKMSCDSCGNTFETEAVQEYNLSDTTDDNSVQWESATATEWTQEEQIHLQAFTCPSCAGELISDENTAATFCPYCDNPAILPGRVSGGLKPDAVIPFKTSKEDAVSAFAALCKGKPLLPKDFASAQRMEHITGIYVPFWLYSCSSDQNGKYRATRVHHWSDSQYRYTRTEHYLLRRAAKADFDLIPMDGSKKMDDSIMESIEPFDYDQLIDFDTAYLSGFLADKYDVPSSDGEERIRQRVGTTMDQMIRSSCIGYTTVVPAQRQLQIRHSKAKYVLLPVWLLSSQYKGKVYTFAMNGQSGKMTGTFPICPIRSAVWFAGICAAVTALVSLIQSLMG